MADSKKPVPPNPPGAKDEIKHARRHIKDAVQAAEEENRRQLLRKRVELAANGVRQYQAKKIGEAVRSFQTYLRIVEDWKGVSEGGLTPAVFDREKEISELLLISGIYWDLTKLYDRTKTKTKEFNHYLEKYVIFARGMPYSSLCRETMRKYIATARPMHSAEFTAAYRLMGGTRCFVATALSDFVRPSTISRLQGFRDDYLKRRGWGRAAVMVYYRRGPQLATRVVGWPVVVKRVLARGLDEFASFLKTNEE